jgi:hypothetical protein
MRVLNAIGMDEVTCGNPAAIVGAESRPAVAYAVLLFLLLRFGKWLATRQSR